MLENNRQKIPPDSCKHKPWNNQNLQDGLKHRFQLNILHFFIGIRKNDTTMIPPSVHENTSYENSCNPRFVVIFITKTFLKIFQENTKSFIQVKFSLIFIVCRI
jgi:hypothetical protein